MHYNETHYSEAHYNETRYSEAALHTFSRSLLIVKPSKRFSSFEPIEHGFDISCSDTQQSVQLRQMLCEVGTLHVTKL